MSDRPRGIGGSDAASALGVDPYRSPVGLWLEKTGRVEPTPAGEAAQWGTILESVLAEQLALATNSQVLPFSKNATVAVAEHPSFMVGTPDGIVQAEDGTVGLVELKTCSIRFTQAWQDGIPLHFQAQSVHYMALTGLPFTLFGCLIGGQKFVVRRQERDLTLEAMLLEREAEFWGYVERDEQPPVAQASAADLAVLYPDSGDGIVSLDDEPGLYEKLKQARRSVEVAKAEQEACENAVKARMGDAATATIGGAKVFTWKSQTAQRVDTAKLKDEYPDVHKLVTREVGSRVFRVF